MKKQNEAEVENLCHQGLIIREIIKDIEQLEVAGELIDKNTPTASRLALFLIDNLAELIMYKRSIYEFRYDEIWPPIFRPRKYSIK
jgi:hypothetical protein